ncbi:uncharacterized protein K452DRAFT_223665 [Aplosporella prunicola CBS 121167]|uniref:NAD(P)-binding domain-containing protein n=1 Tax=Aplosporella prunicola CBS 121167 TaxID=1176127 RepID=A0A6A6BLN4_9PEZI|nr:uncharacterized protein K452DRAFT_223665 [Aplosporella prunicola CBS 121167]KAF2144194.1 hypothetical protein K452DRAFT_223665 [Aplosporella prunicola CBS 121167]
MMRTIPSHVDLLVLGAGWTSEFLTPLLTSQAITFALTTTNGRNGSIPFKFDPDSHAPQQYARLPSAKTVLITFPLRGAGQAQHLTTLYRACHGEQNQWIQLGSSGIFTGAHWNDSSGAYDASNERAIAEDELRACVDGAVLNLAGLYGGARQPRNWVTRVAKTKDQVRAKRALHLVHGDDVARAVVALHQAFTPGCRWLVTDLRVYDWWDLIHAWAPEVEVLARETLPSEEAEGLDYRRWVVELMEEEGVRALPRGAEDLGRVLDSRDFWKAVGSWPSKGRVV